MKLDEKVWQSADFPSFGGEGPGVVSNENSDEKIRKLASSMVVDF